jgi:hypothetical protein
VPLAAAGAVAATQFHPFAAAVVVGGAATRAQVAPARTSPAATKVISHGHGQLGAVLASAVAVDVSRFHTGGRDVRPAHAKPASDAAQRPASPGRHRRPVTPAPARPACAADGTSDPYMLPANYAAIVDFLTAHGYTDMAAAGIAGNIYQESKGDPESVGSGGGGLIGWTPLPAGLVTGNPAADLQAQLSALLTYNQQWAQYIPMLNAATTPTQAAEVFMDYFERPGIPAAYNRESAAQAVAQACGFAT